jgi:C1q domain-containing protein
VHGSEEGLLKIKVYVFDFEVSPRVKRNALRIAIPLALLLGGGALAYAQGLVSWSSGQTLTAANLNSNFSYLQGQITTPGLAPRTPSAFRATMTSTAGITIPSQSNTKVVFNNELFDLGDEYSTSTGIFTPVNAGVYLITCGVEYLPGTFTEFGAVIYDGTTELYGMTIQNGTEGDRITPLAVTTAQLAAGDSVACFAYQGTDSALALSNETVRQSFSATRLY